MSGWGLALHIVLYFTGTISSCVNPCVESSLAFPPRPPSQGSKKGGFTQYSLAGLFPLLFSLLDLTLICIGLATLLAIIQLHRPISYCSVWPAEFIFILSLNSRWLSLHMLRWLIYSLFLKHNPSARFPKGLIRACWILYFRLITTYGIYYFAQLEVFILLPVLLRSMTQFVA